MLSSRDQSTTLAELLGFGEGRTPEIWLNLGLGAVALLTLPAVVRGVAAMHAGTSSALLDLCALTRAGGGRTD